MVSRVSVMRLPALDAKDRLFAIVVLAIVFLDQATKFLALTIPSGTAVPVIGNFLALVKYQNTGAVFGILQNQNIILSIITLIVLLAIGFYYRRMPKAWTIYAALICGGAMGNLVDRIRLGYVIDFIRFSFWPAFNVADAAITIGALGILWMMWKEGDVK